MNSFQVIACDLDGTLLNKDKELSDKSIEVLIAAQQRGYRLILASGRNLAMMMPLALQLQMDKYNGFIVACNGFFTYDFSSELMHQEEPLSTENVKEIFAVAKKYKLQFLAEHKDGFMIYIPWVMLPIKIIVWLLKARHLLKKKHSGVYSIMGGFLMESNSNVKVITQKNQIDIQAVKIGISQWSGYLNIFYPRIIKRLHRFNVLKVTSFWIDIVDHHIDKGHAIGQILEKINIDRSKLIVFGDAQNDIGMITMAGLGVAMENAMLEVKAIAQAVCQHHQQDGVANFIENILNQQSEAQGLTE